MYHVKYMHAMEKYARGLGEKRMVTKLETNTSRRFTKQSTVLRFWYSAPIQTLLGFLR